MRIAISNRTFHRKPYSPTEWNIFNGSFENADVSMGELTQLIAQGHAIAPCMRNGWRSKDEWLCAQHIGIDYDELPSIDHLLEHNLNQLYGGVTYTTMSSTIEKPRARVLFELDRPFTDMDEYADVLKKFMTFFVGSDQACKDPARAFMGSPNCEHWLYGGVLPMTELKVMVAQIKIEQKREFVPSFTGGRTSIDHLIDSVRSAREGTRNVELNKAAFLAGRDVRRALIDEPTAQALLIQAAMDAGLSQSEAQFTVRRSLSDGYNAA